jgi:hypothetical protein
MRAVRPTFLGWQYYQQLKGSIDAETLRGRKSAIPLPSLVKRIRRMQPVYWHSSHLSPGRPRKLSRAESGMTYIRRSKTHAAKEDQDRKQDLSDERNCRPLIAASRKYPRHSRCEVQLDADALRRFALLDDQRRLSANMEKPSLMMAGASMHVETNVFEGKAVGSLRRMTGRVLGMNLEVNEIVTERVSPFRKTWETRGEPRLLVIGAYRMGFTITPLGHRSQLLVFIDYQLPQNGVPRVLGMLVGRAYAAWCTRRMARDAAAAIVRTVPG